MLFCPCARAFRINNELDAFEETKSNMGILRDFPLKLSQKESKSCWTLRSQWENGETNVNVDARINKPKPSQNLPLYTRIGLQYVSLISSFISSLAFFNCSGSEDELVTKILLIFPLEQTPFLRSLNFCKQQFIYIRLHQAKFYMIISPCIIKFSSGHKSPVTSMKSVFPLS